MTIEYKLCWGIYREYTHSPGRENDDVAILRATAAALEERGFDVKLRTPRKAGEAITTPGARIFAMCEQPEVLDLLRRAERTGAIVVNAPEAVRNTYRRRMVEAFAHAGISVPRSRVIATDPETPPPALPVWIKRHDFHATEANDVLFAESADSWRTALAAFAARGLPFAVIQDHAPGDLIKFYGVHHPGAGETRWFVWFYHRDQSLAGHAFDEETLRREASAAAGALGIEIFGGDAIVGNDGRPQIIDLNAWPSFALYRETAATAIADHLAERFARQPVTALG